MQMDLVSAKPFQSPSVFSALGESPQERSRRARVLILSAMLARHLVFENSQESRLWLIALVLNP